MLRRTQQAVPSSVLLLIISGVLEQFSCAKHFFIYLFVSRLSLSIYTYMSCMHFPMPHQDKDYSFYHFPQLRRNPAQYYTHPYNLDCSSFWLYCVNSSSLQQTDGNQRWSGFCISHSHWSGSILYRHCQTICSTSQVPALSTGLPRREDLFCSHFDHDLYHGLPKNPQGRN